MRTYNPLRQATPDQVLVAAYESISATNAILLYSLGLTARSRQQLRERGRPDAAPGIHSAADRPLLHRAAPHPLAAAINHLGWARLMTFATAVNRQLANSSTRSSRNKNALTFCCGCDAISCSLCETERDRARQLPQGFAIGFLI